jgi:hypothetical protein
MSRNGLRRILPIAAAALLIAVVATTQADALYLFYLRKDLSRILEETPKDIVGKQVVVTDDVVAMWPEIQQRPDMLDGKKYVLFDTTHFHCAIPADSMGEHLGTIWKDAQEGYREVTAQIEEVNRQQAKGKLTPSQGADKRRELYWELHRIWKNQPIVTLFGTVDRADFWGPVRGKAEGVATETITIVVDRVDKPRKRWYKTLDE